MARSPLSRSISMSRRTESRPERRLTSHSFCVQRAAWSSLDGVDEPYLVDWMDWKTMHAAERSESHVVYEVDWMSCDVALDILPVDVPEVMYAVLGRVSQVELGEERVRGRQRPDG